ncbi:MAG: (Fe-S)-binding protein [Actinomycetia bacterium]|nr:(Fe-S)-binding protein [Actinomycetes bacterium]
MRFRPPRAAAVLDELSHCNKCGFCLPACPTYLATGDEYLSPRGRLSLAEAAVAGEMPVGEELARTFALCLGCRACESACPSGVRYGRVYEAVRATLFETTRRYTAPPAARALLALVRRRGRFARAVAAGRRLGWLLPPAARAVLGAAPPDPGPPTAPAGTGEPAQYFLGCVGEVVTGSANRAAVALLARAGYGVGVPDGQGCCGALHAHAGDLEAARDLARANVAAFEGTSGPVVNHAGGCGAFLKEYGHLLADDPAWRERAAAFAGRVRDLAEALAGAPRPLRWRGRGDRVALQNSCHLVHVQRIGELPGRLLAEVPEDRLVPWEGGDRCCGSAGLYSLLEPEMAARVAARSLEGLYRAKPTVLVVNNPGCALQWRKTLKQAGWDLPVRSLSEHLLARLASDGPESGP